MPLQPRIIESGKFTFGIFTLDPGDDILSCAMVISHFSIHFIRSASSRDLFLYHGLAAPANVGPESCPPESIPPFHLPRFSIGVPCLSGRFTKWYINALSFCFFHIRLSYPIENEITVPTQGEFARFLNKISL